MSEKHLETLMKTYLELAHVVPHSCKTHRELKLEAEIKWLRDRFKGLATGSVPADDNVKGYALQVLGEDPHNG